MGRGGVKKPDRQIKARERVHLKTAGYSIWPPIIAMSHTETEHTHKACVPSAFNLSGSLPASFSPSSILSSLLLPSGRALSPESSTDILLSSTRFTPDCGLPRTTSRDHILHRRDFPLKARFLDVGFYFNVGRYCNKISRPTFYMKGMDLITYQQHYTAHIGTNKNVKQRDRTKS